MKAKEAIQKIHEMYLDYFNNFVTVERFAEYYGITETEAFAVIEAGKRIHNQKKEE